ncbi:MAG TPA: metal-dependent hydrolase [Gallionella sp.]|nr:metal-dependent hydrolase [Gallionella sp.]
MTAITARIPQVDWTQGFERRWNGGDPAVTHAFNTLSLLFPQAEKFFIEVAREVSTQIGLPADSKLGNEVKLFIAQEAIHTTQHNQYNETLKSQGFDNVIHDFVERLQARAHRYLSPLTKLAAVCAYEHYTAILGNFILTHPQALEPAPADMALIWGWHAAEETEHKAVCFDLYHAAGGRWLRRSLVFMQVTLDFSFMFGRLYFSLLRRDGCLKPAQLGRTTGQFIRFFFGASGVAWHLLGHGLTYFSPWFHPWNQTNRDELNAWLSANQPRLRSLGHNDCVNN